MGASKQALRGFHRFPISALDDFEIERPTLQSSALILKTYVSQKIMNSSESPSGYANFVAHKTRESDAASHDDEDLITGQYQGKEDLKPIYAKLLKEIQAFGDDVTITPKKAAVSCIRKHQFALIKPATKQRIDLGLKLKDVPTTERLGDSEPFGTMCTHRVQITDVTEVDSELMAWVKQAYDKSV